MYKNFKQKSVVATFSLVSLVTPMAVSHVNMTNDIGGGHTVFTLANGNMLIEDISGIITIVNKDYGIIKIGQDLSSEFIPNSMMPSSAKRMEDGTILAGNTIFNSKGTTQPF